MTKNQEHRKKDQEDESMALRLPPITVATAKG